jgi:hypothetical protein
MPLRNATLGLSSEISTVRSSRALKLLASRNSDRAGAMPRAGSMSRLNE